MPRGTAAALALGPGYLYIADLGTTEPTDLITAWTAVSSNWKSLGYTDGGNQFKHAIQTGAVQVAEELDPVAVVSTGRAADLSFVMSELTATNLMRACNAATGTVVAGTGIVSFEPPDLGTEVRRMLGFESEDHTERWIYRQCFQTGDLSIQRQKGNNNATITVDFALEKPATGSKLWKAIMQSPLRS